VSKIGIQVAEALAYAHSQGTLHRDVKPPNLLLDNQGQVWIADFGLAKAADSDDLTATGDIVGTVRYMAPERFVGRSDIRSDVYGLGVTLYEMLTLRPAFVDSDRTRLMTQIVHEEPPLPRKVNPLVPRDLETIVLKAMAKEPAHRYASAADLAADLRRFLDNRPIRPRRVSTVERLWRWSRRNPSLASMAAAILLLVAIFVLVVVAKNAQLSAALAESETKSRESQRQRSQAQANFKMARDAVDQYFTKVSESPSMKSVGLEGLRKDLLLQAKEFYEKFTQEQPNEPALQAELASAHIRLATIYATLGDLAAAETSYRKTNAILEEVSRREPQNPRYQLSLAEGQRFLGWFLRGNSQPGKAETPLKRALALGKQLAAAHPGDPDYQHELALDYQELALLCRDLKQIKSAEPLYREAIAIHEALLRDHPDDRGIYQAKLAASWGNLAAVYLDTGRTDQAESCYHRALEIYRKLTRQFPSELYYLRNLGVSYQYLGLLYMNTSRRGQAEASLRRALPIQEGLVRNHPDAIDYRANLAASYSALGLIESYRSKPEAALALFDQAVPLLQGVLEQAPGHGDGRIQMRAVRIGRCSALAQAGDYVRAAKDVEELTKRSDLSLSDLYDLSVAYARCSDAAAADVKQSWADRARLKHRYSRQALDYLHRSLAGGFKGWYSIKDHPLFPQIQKRDDFKSLLNEMPK
jgi:tetratricopeptide (TPR) repeat protein